MLTNHIHRLGELGVKTASSTVFGQSKTDPCPGLGPQGTGVQITPLTSNSEFRLREPVIG